MSKINILYNSDDKMFGYPNIYLDGKDFGVIKPGDIKSIEAKNGEHELIMSISHVDNIDLKKEGVNLDFKNNNCIYEKINVNDQDLYYIYKSPIMLKNKGKLISVNKNKFDKKTKSTKFWNSEKGVLLKFIILIGLLFLIDVICEIL